MEISKLLSPTLELILKAGEFIKTSQRNFNRSLVEHKIEHNNLVSYVDRMAEEILREGCLKITPNCGFINEEGGKINSDKEYIWIIDPLDGTTNFVHGIPFYAISMALRIGNKTVLGCVLEVERGELFSAVIGNGAFLNGKPIRVSSTSEMRDCLLATGFPFRRFDNVQNYLDMMWGLMRQTRGLRRMGAAALDLSYVACGRIDAFYESNLSPWDVAAGALIINEAGGAVTDYWQNEEFLFKPTILASNGLIHGEIARTIQYYANLPQKQPNELLNFSIKTF